MANLVIALILLFQRVGDRPLTRAIHAGLFLAVAGMALGYLMGFEGRQTTTDASGRVVELAARHSVGVTDENPGLPVTNRSTSGGDVRIPHFFGLHGLQVMLIGALVLSVPRVADPVAAQRGNPRLPDGRSGARLHRAARRAHLAGIPGPTADPPGRPDPHRPRRTPRGHRPRSPGNQIAGRDGQ